MNNKKDKRENASVIAEKFSLFVSEVFAYAKVKLLRSEVCAVHK